MVMLHRDSQEPNLITRGSELILLITIFRVFVFFLAPLVKKCSLHLIFFQLIQRLKYPKAWTNVQEKIHHLLQQLQNLEWKSMESFENFFCSSNFIWFKYVRSQICGNHSNKYLISGKFSCYWSGNIFCKRQGFRFFSDVGVDLLWNWCQKSFGRKILKCFYFS